jgi:DNA polymerase-3 subunit gamma/tau
MLSRDAFNALLKTLEEPPARVTFIMATTEPHKFPATILSRCQHFVFKRLSEQELEQHLCGILHKEETPFDEGAVRLIVRRAAGSVRDGMSLLGQVLALGGEKLTAADTQRVLGLAGQELFSRLLAVLKAGDSLRVTGLVREMLEGGLDLGFFLRELALVWRNMFMLKEAGEAAVPSLDLPEAEARRWLGAAADFSTAHIHAAWQMTLEGQRRVLGSLEPALGLELLLLNIALLPRLLPLEQLSAAPKASSPSQGNAGGLLPSGRREPDPAPSRSPAPAGEQRDTAGTGQSSSAGRPAPPSGFSETADPPAALVAPPEAEVVPFPEDVPEEPEGEVALAPEAGSGELSWDAFMRHAARAEGLPPGFLPLLRAAGGRVEGSSLLVVPADSFAARRLEQQETAALLRELARGCFGSGLQVRLLPPVQAARTPGEVKEAVMGHPCVQMLMQEFDARLAAWGQAGNGSR